MAKAYFVLMIYNEEESILPVIESIAGCTMPAQYERRIIAINDGSTDASQEVLERAARVYPVHTIHYKERRGMPASFKGAFRYLESVLQDDDIVFTLEADGTNDIACVAPLVAEIEKGADVVIASRYAPGAASIGFPRHRLWGSSLINMFLRVLWDVPNVRDCSVLYRVYRGSLLRRYIADDIPFAARKSFAVIAEILLHVSRYTGKFAEVPLRYDYGLKKGPSKMKLLQTLWEYTRITPYTPLRKQPIFWIAAAAFAVRLWGITYGFPDLLVADEPALTRGALTMLKLHTLIPAFHAADFSALYYPPLTSYLYLIVLAPVMSIAYLFSGYASLSQYANYLILDPTLPWIATRALSAFIGALTVYFLGKISERMYPGSGVYAALFLATSFLHVTFSHIARHWVLSMLFETALLWAGFRLFQSGKTRWYVLSGIFSGLAFGSGVMPVLGGLVPGLAHFFRQGSFAQKLRAPRLWIMAALAALVGGLFLLVHPRIASDFLGVLASRAAVPHVSEVLSGLVRMYQVELRGLMQVEPVIIVFAFVGLLYLLRRNRRIGAVLAFYILLSILILYFAFVYLMHYLNLILPALVVLAAVGAFEAVEMAKRRWLRVALIICIFALPTAVALRVSYLWTQPDTRHEARAYVEANIPRDAHIVSWVPYMKIVWPTASAIRERIAFNPGSARLVDETLLSLATSSYPAPAFDVFELGTADEDVRANMTYEWLASRHFDYVIVDRWGTQYPALEKLIAEGRVVARFPEHGDAIDILATDVIGHKFEGPSIAAFSIQRMGPEIWIVKLTK